MAARWLSRRIIGIDIAEPYIGYAQAQPRGAQVSFETGDVSGCVR
jgi:hypothetical protein